MSKLTTHTSDITVRLAVPSDSSRLRTLAALDSARLPEGELVVAETGGQIVAALPLSGGAAIADPFHRTEVLLGRTRHRRLHNGAGGPRAPRMELGGLEPPTSSLRTRRSSS
jgi:hypothetical protein